MLYYRSFCMVNSVIKKANTIVISIWGVLRLAHKGQICCRFIESRNKEQKLRRWTFGWACSGTHMPASAWALIFPTCQGLKPTGKLLCPPLRVKSLKPKTQSAILYNKKIKNKKGRFGSTHQFFASKMSAVALHLTWLAFFSELTGKPAIFD